MSKQARLPGTEPAAPEALSDGVNEHIVEFPANAKGAAIAEGVALAVARWILEHEPAVAAVICADLGGWSHPEYVRALAMTHDYLAVVGWTKLDGGRRFVPVVDVTETAREAASRGWPLELADLQREPAEQWESVL